MNSTEILALVLAVIVLGPILIVTIFSSFTNPKTAMAAGIVSSLLSLSSFGIPELRYVLALVVIPHLGAAIKNSKQGASGYYATFNIPLLYVFVCFVSLLWSLSPSDTFVSSAAWLILLLFVFVFRNLVTSECVRSIVFYVLLGFFVVSLIYLISPEGWAGGRARGIFNNANAAGIYTFLLLGLSLFMGRRFWLWLFPAGLAFIFATGSRAALLAVIVLMAISLLFKVDGRLRLTFTILLCSIVVYALHWLWNWIQHLDVEGDSILRTNNSRASSWEVAFSFIRENPYLGAGYGATPPIIGSSSYIKLVSEFGFLFAGFGFLLAGAYILWSRHDHLMLGITIGTLINTFFEDWLLTAGAPMLAVYLLLVMTTTQKPKLKNLESQRMASRSRISAEITNCGAAT